MADNFIIMGPIRRREDRRTIIRAHINYRRHLKVMRDTNNPFEILSAERFRQFYRFPKTMAWDLVVELSVLNEQMFGIQFYQRVLITLNFLGCGSYQKSLCGFTYNMMSQPSTSRCIKTICGYIVHLLMPKYVRFPTTPAELAAVKQGFFDKKGIRGVIGAVDGTHVQIIAPSRTDVEHPPTTYIDRSGNYSINVMLICDSNSLVLACDARYPGSCHDSAIWQVSSIRRFLRNNYDGGDVESHLIGDSGYALEPFLFTPFLNPAINTPQYRFNVQHKQARNVIERTNGDAKTKFRCLLQHRVLHYHPGKAALIIYASVVLHNILVQHRIDIFDDIPQRVPDVAYIQDARGLAANHAGRLAREAYVTNFYT